MSDAALASSLVALCYMIAVVLFLLALFSMAVAPRPLAGRVALAGLVLAFLTTVCTLDAISLPEMAGTTLCGGGIGWLIAGRSPGRSLFSLAIGLQGLLGLALVFLGAAIGLDPDALGVTPGLIGRTGVISCLGLGVLSMIVAATALWKRDVALLALLSFCSGAGAVLAGLLLANWAMVMAGALVITFLSALIAAMRRAAVRDLLIVHPIP